MNTAGRITATLVLLLGLYVLGFYLLVKRGWASKLLNEPSLPFASAIEVVHIGHFKKDQQQLISDYSDFFTKQAPNAPAP